MTENSTPAPKPSSKHAGLKQVQADEIPVRQARFYLRTYVARATKSASKHTDSAACYGAGIEFGRALADVIHRSVVEECRDLKDGDSHHLLSDATIQIAGFGLWDDNSFSENEKSARSGMAVGMMCRLTDLVAKSKGHLHWSEFSVTEKMKSAGHRASTMVRNYERACAEEECDREVATQ